MRQQSTGAVTGIALIANDIFLVPALVLLASLRGNIPQGLEIIIRDTGLCTRSRQLLDQQVKRLECPLRFVPCDIGRFAEAGLLPHWTSADAFARLLPLHEIAGQHRYLLDLDVDLLVRSTLEPLIESPPDEDCLLSAVPTHFTPTLWSEEVGSTQDLDVRPSDNFFMGGVTIIDTRQWMEAGVSERALELFNRAPHRWKSDLSVLNVLVGHDWTPLDYRWNVWTLASAGPLRFVRVTGATSRSIARNSEVAIAHFPGHFKPWLPHYPMNAWRHEYVGVARQSVLPDHLQPRFSLKNEAQRVARRVTGADESRS
jgi:lipopolysaccharide biosynthesis glycosyltransferase